PCTMFHVKNRSVRSTGYCRYSIRCELCRKLFSSSVMPGGGLAVITDMPARRISSVRSSASVRDGFGSSHSQLKLHSSGSGGAAGVTLRFSPYRDASYGLSGALDRTRRMCSSAGQEKSTGTPAGRCTDCSTTNELVSTRHRYTSGSGVVVFVCTALPAKVSPGDGAAPE